jgi:2-methylcitrate dehydratase PrpD
LPEAVVAGLGTRWHTETLSFKVHPGGPGLDAAVDCALDLHAELGSIEADDVDEILVTTSLYTMVVEQRSSLYLVGTDSSIAALTFSTPYCVASTLLRGNLDASDFAEPSTTDPRRWELAAKVRVEHDVAMTRESLICTAPVGEAIRQAGDRAVPWLQETGGQWLVDLIGDIQAPSETFEHAEKATPARVTIRLRDGRVYERERSVPVGAVGDEARTTHPALVRRKWLGTGGAEQVADLAASLDSASSADVRNMLESALTLP